MPERYPYEGETVKLDPNIFQQEDSSVQEQISILTRDGRQLRREGCRDAISRVISTSILAIYPGITIANGEFPSSDVISNIVTGGLLLAAFAQATGIGKKSVVTYSQGVLKAYEAYKLKRENS